MVLFDFTQNSNMDEKRMSGEVEARMNGSVKGFRFTEQFFFIGHSTPPWGCTGASRNRDWRGGKCPTFRVLSVVDLCTLRYFHPKVPQTVIFSFQPAGFVDSLRVCFFSWDKRSNVALTLDAYYFISSRQTSPRLERDAVNL